ncbi:MAG: SDR family NAD(P)-dependent oxidoreductase, partial [Solirubrobacterales bacterium]
PMTDSRKRLAVVTGASSGIGRELAAVLAEEDFDLLINAEDQELENARTELERTGVSVDAIRADLSKEEGVQRLFSRIAATSRPVDLLALNAGVGAGGAFATDTDLQRELEIVDLNVRSVVYLTKLVLPRMLERGEGRILLPLRSPRPCPVPSRPCTTPRSRSSSRSASLCRTNSRIRTSRSRY